MVVVTPPSRRHIYTPASFEPKTQSLSERRLSAAQQNDALVLSEEDFAALRALEHLIPVPALDLKLVALGGKPGWSMGGEGGAKDKDKEVANDSEDADGSLRAGKVEAKGTAIFDKREDKEDDLLPLSVQSLNPPKTPADTQPSLQNEAEVMPTEQTKNASDWPRRYMDFLASDLLYANMQQSKGIRRKSKLMNAKMKIHAITEMKKAKNATNDTYLGKRLHKQNVQQAIREKKIISRTMPMLQFQNSASKQKTVDLAEATERALDANPQVPRTCSFVKANYLPSSNFLYNHTLPASESAEIQTKNFAAPRGPSSSAAPSPNKQRRETRALANPKEASQSPAFFSEFSSKMPCPGCGRPMYEHSLGEMLHIEASITEEYVRLNRLNGQGAFKNTTNQAKAHEQQRRLYEVGSTGAVVDGPRSKLIRRINRKIDNYEKESVIARKGGPAAGDELPTPTGRRHSSSHKTKSNIQFMRKGQTRPQSGKFLGQHKQSSSAPPPSTLRGGGYVEGEETSVRRGKNARASIEGKTRAPKQFCSSTNGDADIDMSDLMKRSSTTELAGEGENKCIARVPRNERVVNLKPPADATPKATKFTVKIAHDLHSKGAKKPTAKARRLREKVRKDQNSSRKHNAILNRRRTESQRQREDLRKLREDIKARAVRRELASTVISRTWRGKKSRSVVNDRKLQRIRSSSFTFVAALLNRASDNIVKRMERDKQRKLLLKRNQNRAAHVIQKAWVKIRKLSSSKGMWQKMVGLGKRDKMSRLKRRKEIWGAKMMRKAESEVVSMKLAHEMKNDDSLKNSFEKQLSQCYLEEEEMDLKRAIKRETEARRESIRRIDIIESKLVGHESGYVRREKITEENSTMKKILAGNGNFETDGITINDAAWVEIKFGGTEVNRGRRDYYFVLKREVEEVARKRRSKKAMNEREKGGRRRQMKKKKKKKRGTRGSREWNKSLNVIRAFRKSSYDGVLSLNLGINEEWDDDGADNAEGEVKFEEIYRSEVKMSDVRPDWAPFVLPVEELCRHDDAARLRIEVYDWARNHPNDLVGSASTTLKDLMRISAAAAATTASDNASNHEGCISLSIYNAGSEDVANDDGGGCSSSNSPNMTNAEEAVRSALSVPSARLLPKSALPYGGFCVLGETGDQRARSVSALVRKAEEKARKSAGEDEDGLLNYTVVRDAFEGLKRRIQLMEEEGNYNRLAAAQEGTNNFDSSIDFFDNDDDDDDSSSSSSSSSSSWSGSGSNFS